MRRISQRRDFYSQHIIFQQELPKSRLPLQLLYQQCLQEGTERRKYKATKSLGFCCVLNNKDLIHLLKVLPFPK